MSYSNFTNFQKCLISTHSHNHNHNHNHNPNSKLNLKNMHLLTTTTTLTLTTTTTLTLIEWYFILLYNFQIIKKNIYLYRSLLIQKIYTILFYSFVLVGSIEPHYIFYKNNHLLYKVFTPTYILFKVFTPTNILLKVFTQSLTYKSLLSFLIEFFIRLLSLT
jgi:signal transduction histidine kinase